MAYTNDWSDTIPIDHTKFKTAPSTIRQIRIDIEDRLKNMFYGWISGEVQTDEGVKSLPFRYQAGDPGATANKIVVYSKQVSSKTELFVEDEDGNIYQITSKGKLNLGSSRLPNNTNLIGRNAAASGDVNLIKVNASDTPEIPNGVVLSSTAAPTTDPMIPNKKYVDDKVAAVPAQVGLGSWVSKSINTVYQAATDGFLVASALTSGDGYFQLFTDGSNPPTTIRTAHENPTNGVNIGVCCPIRKGDYYKLVQTGGLTSVAIYFISIGS